MCGWIIILAFKTTTKEQKINNFLYILMEGKMCVADTFRKLE